MTHVGLLYPCCSLIIYQNYRKIQLYMPRQPVACRTGCNWSLAVRSILSNGGNCNLCLVATYLQVQSSCDLFWVAQLDFQTLNVNLFCVFIYTYMLCIFFDVGCFSESNKQWILFIYTPKHVLVVLEYFTIKGAKM
jgi:hypothetical protein